MNIKFKNLVLVIAVAGVVTGCQTTKSGSANSAISYNGASPVVVNDIDDKKGYLTKRLGLGPMSSQVPSYDGKGLLTVSWTPTKLHLKVLHMLLCTEDMELAMLYGVLQCNLKSNIKQMF
jgi:hypothetical protein